MNKYILIFIIGIIETTIYASFLFALEKRKIILAPLLMTIYMIIYLSVISTAIKDANTFWMLAVYAVSCGAGVYIRMTYETRISQKNCKLKIK